MPTQEKLRTGFSIGEWEVVPDEGIVRRGAEVIKPEPQTMRVLLALAERDGKLVTKQEFFDEIWDGRATSDEPLTRAIREVRKCFGDSAREQKYVGTLHRVGYKLEQHVEFPGPSLRMWKVVASVLLLGFIGIAVFVGIKKLTDGDVIDSPPSRSIAVMPFGNLSGDEADEYLVLGFKEELVHMLQGMDDYTVKRVRGDYIQLESEDIAEKLGVESLLDGSLRRSGNDLKITYQISKDGSVINGAEIKGSVDDLFSLQESLALIVREDLIGKTTQTLIKSRPSDSKAYDSYMRGVYALEHRASPENLERAIELFQKAIQLDKSYGPPYLTLATVYSLMPDYRRAPQLEMDSLALETVNAGIAADPNLEDAGGFIWGFVYHKQKRWHEAEKAHLRAINADVVDSNAFNWYSRMLASVGRLDEALRIALAGLQLDPSSPLLNSRVAMCYAWLQDTERALEYYERANELGWAGSTHRVGYAWMLLQTGQVEKAQNLTNSALQDGEMLTSWVAPVFGALVDESDPLKTLAAIEALDEAATVQPATPLLDFTVRGLLGDLDGAMQVAELLEQPGEAFEMDLLFVPELAAIRQHPGFMPLLDRLGITDYWYDRGCVWNGDKVNCPKN